MENELMHWGIKGMKWGVRRYQNKDGSLTPAGKKRYDKEMAKLKEEEKIAKNKLRTQAKLNKLDEKRKEIEALKNKKHKTLTGCRLQESFAFHENQKEHRGYSY